MREKEEPMMVGLKRISTVVGVLAVTASTSFGQGVMANPNQMTADTVAGALRVSRSLTGSRIEIEAQGGFVTLTGQLASPALKAEAVARARSVPGVQGVIDRLQIPDRTIRPAQYQPQVALGHGHGGNVGGIGYTSGATGASTSGTGSPASGTTTGGFVSDGSPLPEGEAGGSAGAAGAMPGNPNYAWPSYAPYPNFSAVGYPTAYP
jgi:hypothetical protein